MYRNRRRKKLQRRRRTSVLTAAVAALALVIGVPALASADGVDGVINALGGGGGTTSGGGTASPAPNAGAPPSYVPPLHGTNPHGQGTDAVIDLNPLATNPYPATPADSGEEVVAGDSRGEQDATGHYHGNVTLASVLGFPIIDVTTNEGETKDGPLQPLQDGLDQLCQASGNQLCLELLALHSSTTSSGSNNSFTGANLSIGGQAGINADALSSTGNINNDGNCQVATGHSRVAGVGLAAPAGETADVAEGSSSSTACNDGSQSVSQSSQVINLAGNGIPIPATGCDDGTPNTNFEALSPLLATTCNASDSNSGQTSSPYGVREALTAFVLIVNGNPLIKATTAGPETHAVAPGGAPTTPVAGAGPGNNGGKKGGNKGNNGNGGNEGGAGAGGAGAGAAAGAAGAGNGQLAFTGADLLALGLVGGALILGGLALTTTAGRRHRQTV